MTSTRHRPTRLAASLIAITLLTAAFGSAGASVIDYSADTTIGYSGNIDTYTIGQAGWYAITVVGAAGGANGPYGTPGGAGAMMSGNVFLDLNATLDLVVGGVGTAGPTGFVGGGGGGGSFVYTEGSTIRSAVLVAGGGGGSGGSVRGGAATTGTSGTSGGGGAGGNGGSGGANGGGGGGGGGFASQGGGGGGAGFLTDGTNGGGSVGPGSGGNHASFSGGGGGAYRSAGGFGGGGGGSDNSGGGGGGGYSGGGGGGSNGGGGGAGGSFASLDVLDPIFSVFNGSGNGFIEIRYLAASPSSGAVPEPGALALMSIGFGGLLWTGRRRREAGRPV